MAWRTAISHHVTRRSLSSTAARFTQPVVSLKSPEDITNEKDYRASVAPWLKIGHFEPGLLSHLSTPDIARALLVLRVCSLDPLVERSPQLFELALKLGPLAKWPLKKTFFDQFVGGDGLERMTEVVTSMQKRGLTLMVAPVLEEDVDDAASSKKTYENNFHSLLDLADMTTALDKNGPIMQLKVSAITPCLALEEASAAILAQSSTPEKAAKLIEDMAASVENPSKFPLALSPENTSYLIDGLKRADLIAKKAQEKSMYITVDAEFYSCRAAISAFGLALMARYNNNSRSHFMGNTIQAYFKDAVQLIKSELEITKLLGVNWYGKVVRGAYMDRERKIASAKGLPSPICDSYADTCNSYNSVVDILLRQMSKDPDSKAYLTVATHNENSIRLAAQKMRDFGMENSAVSFAQIYGMADYLSTPLVEQGYKVYKSTPYGPMEKVMPYLSRRASENRSVIQGAREEREMLYRELKHRLRLI